MQKIFCLLLSFLIGNYLFSQSLAVADSLKLAKDSLLLEKGKNYRRQFTADSIKIENEFANKAKWERLKKIAIYPLLNAARTVA